MSATKIQVRRDVASNWTSENPVLNAGEFGLDLTSMKLKIGDGSSTWSSLDYIDDDGPTLSTGTVEPTGSSHGDLFVNTSTCPPVLYLYSDPSQCPNDSGWNPIGVEGNIEEVSILPLNVTPQPQDTTSLTVVPVGLTIILPDSKITYKWYQYDQLEGGIGTELRTLVSDSAISDTYIPVGADMGKYIGCTVSYLGETVSETTRATIGTAGIPVASMHGLRFDRDRYTRLTRKTTSTIGTTFTFSCWVKPTEIEEPNRLFTIYDVGGSTYSMARIKSDYTIRCYLNTDGSSQPDTVASLNPREWNHICFTVENNKWTVVINNGTPQVMGTSSNNTNPGSVFGIGGFEQNSNDYEVINGYLSDCYFVDGVALDCTAFGQEYTLGWGPLDSSIVKNIIGAEQITPYDTRPNMDQKWSDIFDAATGANYTFDGDLVNTGSSIGGSAVTLTLSPSITGSSVTGYIANGSNIQAVGSIDGIVTSEAQTGGSYQPVTAVFPSGEQEISEITVSAGGDCSGIAIDDILLVDGPADNSERWSEGLSVSDNFQSGMPFNQAFDGNLTTRAGNSVVGSGTLTWKFNIDIQTKIEFLTGNMNEVIINNGINLGSASGDPAWLELNGSRTVTEVRIEANQPGTRADLYAVKVDGKLLVDSPFKWDTTMSWSNHLVASNDGDDVTDQIQNPLNAFDGDIDTESRIPFPTYNGDRVMSFELPIAKVATSLKINAYTIENSPNLAGVYFRYNNGSWVEVGDRSIGSNWIDLMDFLSIPSGTQITEVGYRMTQTGASIGLRGIEINGEIFVNPSSFGSNGFYLPFDTEVEGISYSKGAYTKPWYPGNEPENMFDGDPDTSAHTADNGEPTYVPVGMTVNESIEMYGTCGTTINGGPDWSVVVDGTIYPVKTGGVVADVWHSVPGLTFPCNFESIGATYGGRARIWRVDGKELLDINSIGIDDSGEDNHFKQTNFLVGNTSKVWSNITSHTGTIFRTPEGDNRFTPQYIFDGNLEGGGTGIGPYRNGTMTLTHSFNGSHNFTFYTGMQPGGTISFNGSVVYTNNTGTVLSPDNPINVTGTDVTSITWASNSNNDNTSYMYGIKVDGELLLNGNFQDGVVDTPMKNYPIILAQNNSVANNGNLRIDSPAVGYGQSNANVKIEADSGKYYWEVYPSDVTTGNLEVGVTTEDTPTSGSIGSKSTGWSYISSNGFKYNSAVTSGYGADYTNDDIVGVTFDSDTGEIAFFNEGEYQGVAFTGIPKSVYPSLSDSSNSSSSSTFINFGQQKFAGTNIANHDLESGLVTLSGFTSQNTTEIWSNVTSASGSSTNGTLEQLFNGNLTDGYYFYGSGIGLVNARIAFDGTVVNVQNTVKVYVDFPPGHTNYLHINDSPTNVDWVSVGSTYSYTVPFTGVLSSVTNFDSAQIGNSQSTITGIEVDGKLLVDGDPTINRSEIWSSGVDLNGNQDWESGREPDKMFDGNTTTFTGTGGQSWRWNINPIWGLSGTLEVMFEGSGDGITTSSGGNYVSTDGTSYVNCGNIDGLTYIETVVPGNPVGSCYIRQIKVNGKRLVDAQGFAGGTFKTVYQTWTQQQSVFFKSELSRLGNYELALRAVAAAYINSGSFDTGAIVAHNGELWQALVDDAEATEPSEAESATWKRLNLSE